MTLYVPCANNSLYSGTNLSDNTKMICTYRARHVAARDMTAAQFTYINGVSTNDNGTATVTYKPALECSLFPSGYVPMLISGSASGAAATGTAIQTDLVTLPVTIPAGTTFWSRTAVSVAVLGQQWAVTAGMTSTPNPPWGDGVTPDADTAYGTGVMTNGANNSANLLPLVICNQDTADFPSVVVFGDSIGAGGSDTQDALYDQGWLSRAFEGVAPTGSIVPYANLALQGATAQGFAGSNAPVRKTIPTLCKFRTGVLVFGNNDVPSRTTNQIIADLTTSIGLVAPNCVGGVWLATLPPRTTSTDSWATPVVGSATNNQTAASGFAVGGVREQVNAWIRTTALSISGVAGVIDIADAVESFRNSSFWKGGTGVTANIVNGAYTADGTHQTSWGSRVTVRQVPVGQMSQSSSLNQLIG